LQQLAILDFRAKPAEYREQYERLLDRLHELQSEGRKASA
jgi:hypothetical protein